MCLPGTKIEISFRGMQAMTAIVKQELIVWATGTEEVSDVLSHILWAEVMQGSDVVWPEQSCVRISQRLFKFLHICGRTV